MATTNLQVCDQIFISFNCNIAAQNSSFFIWYAPLHMLSLTGKAYCNCSVLVSWKWVPLFMEQYYDNRRLLFLLVPGKQSLSSSFFWISLSFSHYISFWRYWHRCSSVKTCLSWLARLQSHFFDTFIGLKF